MSPEFVFIFGLGLLFLFIWYFATEKPLKKRSIGTALTVLLVAFCIHEAWPPIDLVDKDGKVVRKGRIEQGIDLKGGSSFIMRLQPDEGKPVTMQGREQALKVLQKRLNSLGTKDSLIAPQGEDRILIQMPGLEQEKVEEVKAQLAKVAKLEFKIVHEDSAALVPQIEAGETIRPGWEIKTMPEGEKILVPAKADLSGAGVKAAWAEPDQGFYWKILLRFDSKGADDFDDLAERYYQRRLAILLDGEALSAPTLQTKYFGGSAEITGNFKEMEARNLSSALENPLENELKYEETRYVTPTLGRSSITKGFMAMLSGLAMTLIFLMIYYNVAGIVAIIGLTVNLVMLIGAMAMFNFTLTLPGIAGIILTIGISIDANVLIYERLKEELSAGKSLGAAIQSAYDKAFSAIFDANVTTLITSFILFWKATGAVRGFAVTLTLGILCSMFAALLVTRVFFGWLVATGLLKKLKLWTFVAGAKFDFLGKRKVAALLSLVLVALSAATLVVNGNKSLGIDFRGGDLVTIKASGEFELEAVKADLNALGVGEVFVQKQFSPDDGSDYLSVRSEAGTSPKIIAELKSKFPDIGYQDVQQDQVGSLIAGEMAVSSLMALGLALVGILLYVTVRFEFSFAIGALVALLHDILIAVGILVISGRELSLISVGAFLTIAGYSINDTIVVFDRIREGLRTKRGNVEGIMNLSLNMTLRRTILTSLTTLITIVTLYFFGGPALKDFSFIIIIGVIVGTYSSIFVASPVVLLWTKIRKSSLRREVLDSDDAAIVS